MIIDNKPYNPTFIKFCQSCKGTYLLALNVNTCPRCFSNLLVLKEMETEAPAQPQKAVLSVPNRHERRRIAKLAREARD